MKTWKQQISEDMREVGVTVDKALNRRRMEWSGGGGLGRPFVDRDQHMSNLTYAYFLPRHMF